MPPQPSACTTHVGSHHLRSATTGKRSASTALVGTHNLANTDAYVGSVPFPKPRALVLPLVHFGQSKPEGHFCGDLVHWKSRIVNVLVFSSCPGAHMNGVWIHMAATSLTTRCLAWDLGTNLLIFQCSFIYVIPICPDPAASCEVTKHNKEDLRADMTKNVCRDDVHQENAHDCAPFSQGVLSVSFLHF